MRGRIAHHRSGRSSMPMVIHPVICLRKPGFSGAAFLLAFFDFAACKRGAFQAVRQLGARLKHKSRAPARC